MSSSQDVGELLEMLALSTLCSTEDKEGRKFIPGEENS